MPIKIFDFTVLVFSFTQIQAKNINSCKSTNIWDNNLFTTYIFAHADETVAPIFLFIIQVSQAWFMD